MARAAAWFALGLSLMEVGSAAAEKPAVAVVPFTGPAARRAEEVVARVIKRRAKLIPGTRWLLTARKRSARTTAPEDIAVVAHEIGAQAVVTGLVKREGRSWQLVVTVRDGASGKSRDRLRYTLKGPRLTPQVLGALAREVDEAIQQALTAPPMAPAAAAAPAPAPAPAPGSGSGSGSAPASASAPAPASAPPPPPPTPSGRKRGRGRLARTEEEPPPPPPVVAPPPPPAPTVVATPPPPSRPRWAPYFDVSLAGSVVGRAFDMAPATLPRFTSTVVGGLRFDATIFPLAMTWRSAAGVFSGLGLGVTLDKPFWPPSTSRQQQGQFATSELRVEGGLRWRFTLYKPVPRPELVLFLGGGLHTFSIEKLSMAGVVKDVGPPDVGYTFLAVGGGLRLHFAEWARIFATVTYLPIFDAGAVHSASEYGAGTAWAIRVQGGLEFFVWRGLKLAVLGFYERYTLSFDSMGAAGTSTGATDQYYGALLGVGYEY